MKPKAELLPFILCLYLCMGKGMIDDMKTIQVAAAIIKGKNERGEDVILATRRGYGAFKGGWEFPGGKLEQGESAKQALVREIREELEVDIEVGNLFERVEYDYPDFHLSMDCFQAEIRTGKLILNEHEEARWLTADEITSVSWLPADIALVEKLQRYMKEHE